MTVKALSSETRNISTTQHDYVMLQAARNFAAELTGSLLTRNRQFIDSGKAYIRITVEVVPSNARVGSKTQREMLKAMIAEGSGNAWYNAKGKYLFEFHNDKFMWGNRDLYLTAGEKLALYKRLIRDEAMDRMTTSRLRKKFGKDFLEGFI